MENSGQTMLPSVFLLLMGTYAASVDVEHLVGVCERGQQGEQSLCECTGTEVKCGSRELTSLPHPSQYPRETTRLYLNDNPITVIPSSGVFETLTNLTHLCLKRLHLHSIEDNAFKGLYRLKVLELNGGPHSSLRNISSRTFAHLWNLNKLDFRGHSNLAGIAFDAFIETVNLQNLILGNSLRCDCGLKPFKDWTTQKGLPQENLRIFAQCDIKHSNFELQLTMFENLDYHYLNCQTQEELPQTCYTCNGVESLTQCQTLIQCQDNETACQTTVQISKSLMEEQILITKKCTALPSCQQDGLTNPTECMINPSQSICHSCCVGQQCNANDGLPLELLPCVYFCFGYKLFLPQVVSAPTTVVSAPTTVVSAPTTVVSAPTTITDTTTNNASISKQETSLPFEYTTSETSEQPASTPFENTTSVTYDQPTSIPFEQTTSVTSDQTTSVPFEQPTSITSDQTTSVPFEQTTLAPFKRTTSAASEQTTLVTFEHTTSARSKADSIQHTDDFLNTSAVYNILGLLVISIFF